MNKLIIKFDDSLKESKALEYVQEVIKEGRISYNIKGEQYCYLTKFPDNSFVAAFKPSKTTDTFHIYCEKG